MTTTVTLIYFFFVLVGVTTSTPVVKAESQPRLLFGFAQFVYHYTGRNPLDYNNYGCWCGIGNRGSNTVDAIDQCCKTHDGCYKGEDDLASYYLSYNYNCINAVDSAQYKACMCDKTAAQCFAANTYDPKWKGQCV